MIKFHEAITCPPSETFTVLFFTPLISRRYSTLYQYLKAMFTRALLASNKKSSKRGIYCLNLEITSVGLILKQLGPGVQVRLWGPPSFPFFPFLSFFLSFSHSFFLPSSFPSFSFSLRAEFRLSLLVMGRWLLSVLHSHSVYCVKGLCFFSPALSNAPQFQEKTMTDRINMTISCLISVFPNNM